MTKKRTSKALLAVAVVTAVAVTAGLAIGLGEGQRTTAAAATRTSTAPPPAGITELWHRLAQCLRSHGYPQIRDPRVAADGTANWGTQETQVKYALRALGTGACHNQLAAIPASAFTPRPTPAELHRLVLFARCMRAHGLRDWPDPRPDGTFPLNQRLIRLGKRGIAPAVHACSRLSPPKGIQISASSLPGKPGSKNG